MNDWQLPEDLQQLEDELMALPRPILPDSLLSRLDGEVRVHMRGERIRWWYAYVAVTAAAALLWANLSLRITLGTNLHMGEEAELTNVRLLEEQLHELLPELDAREVRRQVVMLRADSHVTALRAPSVLATSPGRLPSIEKVDH